MGVPVFFKWLCMRNPKIIRDACQADKDDFNSGNPYVDNFYVDMNGLIHPACNPKEQNIKEPANFDEQCNNIFDYIDKLMNIVRPKRTLYLAIDGVAPRAKMNQQRSRRFRAAMEGAQVSKIKSELLEKYKSMDTCNQQLENYAKKVSFDSNLITPGTKFLNDVSNRIRQYIREQIATNRLWKNLVVIFSDANCPGEGQHKLMEFIRQERASKGYDTNQHHCIYGADADLIMLGLSTHEPRFYIIREVVVTANDKWCTSCGRRGHYFMDCQKANSIEAELEIAEKHNRQAINVTFQFINIKMIREFIHLKFMKATINFKYNLERIIDDFIFLCFFVGNDFLPHVPCLSIREGGIDVLMRVYEYCLELMPAYITNEGNLNLPSLKIFLHEMSLYEKELVSEMIEKENYAKQRQNSDRFGKDRFRKGEQHPSVDQNDLVSSFKEELKKITNPDLNINNYSVFSHSIYSYKEKYYKEKFRISPCEFLQLRTNLSRTYIEALHWICLYYYRGVPSWSWFYPFHYSPFFTDIVNVETPVFQLGRPFRPFQQLMAVLPPKTYYALPQCLHYFMLDIGSPIADYFPSEFVIDLVGKKFAWLGEVLLPFIDDKRLLKAIGNYESQLTRDQLHLNRLGKIDMFMHRYGNLGRSIGQIQIGDQLEFQFQNHWLEGVALLLECQGDVAVYDFVQPSGRTHDVQLKDGIEYTILEDLDEEFVSRTDKKGFGGERFVRVIERVLGQRMNHLRRQSSAQSSNHSKTNSTAKQEQSRPKQRSSKSRSRSRDKDRQRGSHDRNRGWKDSSGYRDNEDRRHNDNHNERERHGRDRPYKQHSDDHYHKRHRGNRDN